MLLLYKLAIEDEVDVLKVNQRRSTKAHVNSLDSGMARSPTSNPLVLGTYLDSQLASHVPAEGVVTDHHPTQIPHNGRTLLTTRY